MNPGRNGMDRQPNTRRLRFFLRDFRMVEADAHFVEGQSLAAYMAQRRSWVNLLDADWIGTGERVGMVALRVGQILWVESRDGGVPAASPAGTPREVEVRVEGGLIVRGRLPAHERQRLADYLESAGPFVPLLCAQLMRSGRPPRDANLTLRDVAINRDVIQTVSEVAG